MKQTVAGLLIERYPPEKPKFRSSVLLVHGLWATGECWQTWATHFSNLGWDCRAINLPGRIQATSLTTLLDLNLDLAVEELARVVNSFSPSPVVVTHGVGALVALKAAEKATFAALVLASPVPPRNAKIPRSRALKLLRLKYLPLIFLRRPFRIEEKDLRKTFLAPLPETLQTEISRKIIPESNHLVQELFQTHVDIEPGRIGCPCLVLAGGQDQLIPTASSHDIARWLGADFKEYPGQGHWIIEASSEPIVRDIHRWLVQNLGDRVLIAELS